MASPDPEIKNGFSFPLWMKAKGTKDFESFATSPPAPEDSFFFIKYPKSDVIFGKQTEPESQFQNVKEPSDVVKSAHYNGQERDWSKHTQPCQEVLHGKPIAADLIKPSKPKGTDDGFKGEGAACGNSIVKVANEMIQSRPATRGFTVASPAEDPEDNEAREKYHMARRGSKSLPVTPAHSPPSSPKSRRKKIGNRYFTSPFEPAAESGSRSWLSTALLGLQRDLSTSTSTLLEENAIEARLQGATLAESVENLGPSPRIKDLKQLDSDPIKPPQTKSAQVFRPKPSELREMNFWSPTSM